MSVGLSDLSAGRMKKGSRLWRAIPLVLLLLGLSAYQTFAVQCDGEDCEPPDEVFTSSTQTTRVSENGLGSPSGGVVYNGSPADCPADFEAQAMLLINVERSRVGLSPLELDTRLQAAARWFSNDVAVNGLQDPPHEGSDGSTPQLRIEREGYNATESGETLGLGLGGGLDTPQEAVEGWMNSMSHKEILLGDFEHIGLGYTHTPTGDWNDIWVADFANTAGARSAPPMECDPGYHEMFFPIIGK